ncbi:MULTISPECIES: DNA topoisomerase IV subunit A [Bordetella]|uniref:DNA topoisomerase 4 subunit A n=2 Tax=Bordetella TaxID=517 RepID=K0M9I4_BORPB|nr:MULTISPECIES: DNA topoisomerase IV subunit A [Bordetella]KAK59508.1 DNA topoisomerase IV, A subunit [Bordetella bronchiseptica 980-2]AMG89371.1 DNA topoisomerase IV subunit A [Bordetella bronchiseptica]AWP79571.1 topoisomerase IV subunit A [Bordetella bronchiseptica]KCV48116.1 DNA topoisomerase IV, A subunit [Bordetella bronchiseptica 3E44]KCV64553.1 DNA topoisomerase IV, A subunit [Bordetella bronchiseptica 980]
MSDSNQPGLFDGGATDPHEAITLGRYAEQAYLDYAVSVVRGRALPDVGDGQKPVQRRILYAMQAMGLAAGAKPVKSARVVGDVLGKYHPHGDQAAYDAMVRMAQDFSLRYPLIDGHGNFGSRDGDNAAAMRYTEARLTPFSKLLLDELEEGTVDFVPNYDGSQQEPAMLPARLPVMLLNGASGIAVGMATEIPSHNLREVAQACVALIRNPKLPQEELLALVPGPDFAGGGQIITPAADIAQIYATGRGSLKARARWQFEEMARGQWQLVVTELPPGTSGQKVLEEIEEITNPKVRAGKKSLSAEQQQAKAVMLSLLDAVRDESGKDAAVRLVFEPKTSRVDRDEFVNTLLAQTSMESNVPVNVVCIGTDGRPRQKSLRDVLEEWVAFRTDTVVRRTRHRLDKVLDRIHVLEGRMVVYLNVDEVIQTIREAEEPRAALMARFGLTERQAEDILEMRLRQLARLEGIKIEQELAGKREEQLRLQDLLDNPGSLKRLLIKEIEGDAKQYGDDRRTLIETAERAVLETKVVDEPVTVIVSQKGWLRARQGHGHDAGQFSFKQGDDLYGAFECRTTDTLIAVGDNGRVYSVAVSGLPSARGDGQPVTTMIDLEAGTRIVHTIAAAPGSRWLLATRRGFGFAARLSDMSSRQRAGKQFITLEQGDELLRPVPLFEGATQLALLSAKGKFLVFGLDEVKSLSGGGRGTILMGLDTADKLDQTVPIGAAGLRAAGIYRNKQTEDILAGAALAPYVGKRARKGRQLDVRPRQPVLSPVF